MNNLYYANVMDLSKMIKNKDLSPVELMEYTITQIEARNDEINAFVHLDYESALNEAKKAEESVFRGEEIKSLHGIPSALKDLFDFKPGWPTTFGGIPAMKNNIANFHSLFAERIEQSGAILIGKTNSPIMGFRGTCDNPLFGPTKNPFELTKNSGGSSGGSAAAVADGLLPFAQGTDGGGSIRIPSSWCGLFGYQPSAGRSPTVMRPNGFGGVQPFIYDGPIARTVDDAAVVMEAISGYHGSDPFALTEDINFFTAKNQSMKGWKVAYTPNFNVFHVDPKIKEVVKNAALRFEEAGAHVEEVDFNIQRDQKELSDLWSRMIMGASIGAFEGFKNQGVHLLKDHRDELPEQFIYWLEKAYDMSYVELMHDQMMRTEIFDALQTVFEKYDVIISPTVGSLPVENKSNGETVGPTEINGEKVDPLIGWCMTYFTNFTGHPAASIPAGLVDDKYPVGMQIIGKRSADLDVFTASYTFEEIQPWDNFYNIPKARH